MTFYLEMSWLYVLHGASETDWEAATIDHRKVAPYLDHLAKAREVFGARSGANEVRRSLAASPVPKPEVSPPPPPPPPPPTVSPNTGSTDSLNGSTDGSNGFDASVIVMFVVAGLLVACACAMGCVWLRSLKEQPPRGPSFCPVSGVTLIPRTIASQRTRQVRIDPSDAPKGPTAAVTTTTTADREGPDPIARPPMPHAAPLPPPASLPGSPPASTSDSTLGSIMRAERLERARAEKRGQ